MVPLVYSPKYNITACSLEKRHPFDGCKYGRIHAWLVRQDSPRTSSGRDLSAGRSFSGCTQTRTCARCERIWSCRGFLRFRSFCACRNHNAATYLVTPGNVPPREQIAFTPTENDFPHLGAQVAFARPHQHATAGTAPTSVSLPDPVSDGPFTCPGQNGGFLGASYALFSIHGDPNDDDFAVHGLHDVDDDQRLAERRALLDTLNGGPGQRTIAPVQGRRVEDMDRYHQQAFALLASQATRRAFDIQGESNRVLDWYGRHKYGQSLLLARRLVEAGVRLVTVYWVGA